MILDNSLVAEEYAIGFRKGEEALAEALIRHSENLRMMEQ